MERDVVHRELEFAHEQLQHLGADVMGHLEAHRLVEAPASQLHLDGLQEVVGLLLLQREVGVAADPERCPVLHDHPHEEPVELGRDQLLDGQVATRRHLHQSREELGDLEPGEATVAGLRIRDVDRQREREIRDVGERVAGVDGQRSEHREDALVEPVVEFGAFLVGHLVPRDDVDPDVAQLGDEPVDVGAVDPVDELEHPVADLGQRVRRRAAVRRWPVDAGDDLVLQRGDAYLEELVEVGGGDGAELGALQQRDPRFVGEVEDTLVELQPAEFAVREPFVGHRSVVGSAGPASAAAIRRRPRRSRGPTRW